MKRLLLIVTMMPLLVMVFFIYVMSWTSLKIMERVETRI